MRLRELDYLRGYAVLLVMFFHLELSLPRLHEIGASFFAYSDLETGVDIFFVISGYVIAAALAPLWRGGADPAPALRYCLVFYQKRLVRLWPASALWLTLNVALALIFARTGYWPAPMDCLKKMILGLVYLYNFQEYTDPTALGYFWSLSVEWQFYLIFPLLLVFVRKDSWRALTLIALLIALTNWPFGGGNWWMFRSCGLILGILTYMLTGRLKLQLPHYGWLEHRFGAAVFTLVLLLAIPLAAGSIAPHPLGIVLASGLATLLIATGAANRGYISTFGMRRAVAWLGSRSYSLYLVHMPCILIFLSINTMGFNKTLYALWLPNSAVMPARLLTILLMISLAAELTYRFVETPSHHVSRAIAAPALTD
jgi:peptidoglycan/LPS O-acetylase OafA/YrhL